VLVSKSLGIFTIPIKHWKFLFQKRLEETARSGLRNYGDVLSNAETAAASGSHAAFLVRSNDALLAGIEIGNGKSYKKSRRTRGGKNGKMILCCYERFFRHSLQYP
jgi:hypothetical protein